MKALFLALAMLAAQALQADDCLAEKVAWQTLQVTMVLS